MASNEDVLKEAENKKCRCCKSNIEKFGVKCVSCARYYHHPCALKITGLKVASGSKGLIICPGCEKNAGEGEQNSAATELNNEINKLNQKIDELENQKTNLEKKLEENSKKMASTELKENDISGENECMRKLVKVLEEKNQILQENGVLWKEKAIYLEEKMKETEIKKGKQVPSPPSLPPVSTSSSSKGLHLKIPAKHLNPPADGTVDGRFSTSKSKNLKSRNGSSSKPETTEQVKKPETEIQILNNENNTEVPKTGEVLFVTDEINPKIKPNENNSDQKWTTVESRKTKKMARYEEKNWESRKTPIEKRPAPTRGTKESDFDLLVADKIEWLFVSGFDPETQNQHITEYIKKHGINKNCICEKMNTKRDKERSSFRLGVPAEYVNEVMSGSMWPVGIVVNFFMNIQSQRNWQKKPVQPQRDRV